MKKFEYMRPETLEGAAEEIKNGGVAMAGRPESRHLSPIS